MSRRHRSPIFAIATSLYAECRAEFADHLAALYEQAETEANGVMLNARGKRRGIDPESLLYGPRSRLDAYGSEELVQFLDQRGRLTYAAFEKTWITGRLDLAS